WRWVLLRLLRVRPAGEGTPWPTHTNEGDIGMNTRHRPLLGLAVLVALVGCTSNAGSGDTPATSRATAPATTSPADRPLETGEPVPEVMTGGRYLFGPFGDTASLTIVATGPKGWVGYPSWAMDGPEPV